MKKGLLIFLIGLGALVAGGIIAATGLLLGGAEGLSYTYQKEMITFSDEERLEQAKTIELRFKTIAVEVFICDREDIEIEYYKRFDSRGKQVSRLALDNSGDKIKYKEETELRIITFNIGVTEPKTIVRIPKSYAKDVKIYSGTGNVRLHVEGERVYGGEINLETRTGSAEILTEGEELKVEKDVILTATTGKVAIDGKIIVKGRVILKATTGAINVDEVEAKSLSAELSTGRISINNGVTAEGEVDLESSTGNIVINGEITAKKISIECDTGDLKAKGGILTADEIELTADTGDIEVVLSGERSDYTVTVETDTGDSNISNSYGGAKRLNVETDTGDIDVTFAQIR